MPVLLVEHQFSVCQSAVSVAQKRRQKPRHTRCDVAAAASASDGNVHCRANHALAIRSTLSLFGFWQSLPYIASISEKWGDRLCRSGRELFTHCLSLYPACKLSAAEVSVAPKLTETFLLFVAVHRSTAKSVNFFYVFIALAASGGSRNCEMQHYK